MIDLRAQTFGVEIEMTGITRNQAAKTIAAYFGTEASHYGGGYDAHHAKARPGRPWPALRASRLRAPRPAGR